MSNRSEELLSKLGDQLEGQRSRKMAAKQTVEISGSLVEQIVRWNKARRGISPSLDCESFYPKEEE